MDCSPASSQRSPQARRRALWCRIRCGKGFEREQAWVDPQAGGFICVSCREVWRDLIELDADDLRNLAGLRTPRGAGGAAVLARPRVSVAIEEIVVHHLGRKPKAAS